MVDPGKQAGAADRLEFPRREGDVPTSCQGLTMSKSRKSAVRKSAVTERHNRSTGAVTGYQLEVWHDGLNEHSVLSARDRGVLNNKLNVQLLRWEEKYGKRLERESGIAKAEKATRKAQAALQAYRDILHDSLIVDHRVDWESLLNREEMIHRPKNNEGIKYDERTGEPVGYSRVCRRKLGTAPEYSNPYLGLLDRLMSSRRNRKEEEARNQYEQELEEWQKELKEETDRVDRLNAARKEEFRLEREQWEADERKFMSRQQEANVKVDDSRQAYEQWDGENAEVILQHAVRVLETSEYPYGCKFHFELVYNPASRTIVIDEQVPLKESMPSKKSLVYVHTRKELKESYISERERTALHEGTLHQVALRTIHELYEADEVGAFEAVVFNGWLKDVNPATGRQEEGCIMSVQALREEFLALNLAEVEPKACYRALKGTLSSQLMPLTPVEPIRPFAYSWDFCCV